MNEESMATEASPAPPGLSPMWLAGAAMWILVIAIGGYMLYSNGNPEAGVNDPGHAANENDGAAITVSSGDPDVELEEVPALVDDFSLVNQAGEKVTRDDLLGKQWVASFIFTNCAGPCNDLTRRVMELNNATKDADVHFVSFTVDPERDTPQQLSNYGEIFGADPERWSFLTGEQLEIYKLIIKSFNVAVAEEEEPNKQLGYEFAHSTRLMHVNDEGEIIGTYRGENDAEVAILRRVLQGKAETPEQNRFVRYEAKSSTDDKPKNGEASKENSNNANASNPES